MRGRAYGRDGWCFQSDIRGQQKLSRRMMQDVVRSRRTPVLQERCPATPPRHPPSTALPGLELDAVARDDRHTFVLQRSDPGVPRALSVS